MFEHITASEVAGYGVGALLLCATFSATKVDSVIAASQRSSLGVCKRCGDLRLIACSKCRGSGLIDGQGQFGFNLAGGGQQSFRVKPTKAVSISCSKCQARGHFGCPTCSKGPEIPGIFACFNTGYEISIGIKFSFPWMELRRQRCIACVGYLIKFLSVPVGYSLVLAGESNTVRIKE